MWFKLYCLRKDIFFLRWMSVCVHLSFYYRPPTRLREGNVFKCVCLSVNRRGSHYLWYIGPRCTRTHPHIRPYPFCAEPDPPLVISSGQDWRPVQPCSLEEPPLQYWHLVTIKEAHTVSASGGSASYWNAFLFRLQQERSTQELFEDTCTVHTWRNGLLNILRFRIAQDEFISLRKHYQQTLE